MSVLILGPTIAALTALHMVHCSCRHYKFAVVAGPCQMSCYVDVHSIGSAVVAVVFSANCFLCSGSALAQR